MKNCYGYVQIKLFLRVQVCSFQSLFLCFIVSYLLFSTFLLLLCCFLVEFKPYFLRYANNEAEFFVDYAKAHTKMSELGAKFDPPDGIVLD